MSNEMFNLLVVTGPEPEMNTFRAKTGFLFIGGVYESSEIENQRIKSLGKEYVAICFSSNWIPPYDVIEKMSKVHPKLRFELTYEEEQVRYYEKFCKIIPVDKVIQFCGIATFLDGELIEHQSGELWYKTLESISEMQKAKINRDIKPYEEHHISYDSPV